MFCPPTDFLIYCKRIDRRLLQRRTVIYRCAIVASAVGRLGLQFVAFRPHSPPRHLIGGPLIQVANESANREAAAVRLPNLKARTDAGCHDCDLSRPRTVRRNIGDEDKNDNTRRRFARSGGSLSTGVQLLTIRR